MFKTSHRAADDLNMSEPANETLHAPTLPTTTTDSAPDLPAPTPAPLPLTDGELPRLAETAQVAPAARTSEPAPIITPPLTAAELPTLPDRPALPTVDPTPPAHDTPVSDAIIGIPDPTSEGAADEPDGASDDDPEHPMAHLMMTKAAATEASKRAAAIRAEQKAKARKIKIGVVVGLLTVALTVGPFVGKWVIDGVNEVGNTTDEP